MLGGTLTANLNAWRDVADVLAGFLQTVGDDVEVEEAFSRHFGLDVGGLRLPGRQQVRGQPVATGHHLRAVVGQLDDAHYIGQQYHET